ncbi:MAG: SIMPL domain-containing protein [Candidatus Vogelbacteria bacterium]|nr:SIMPL domain-containing protein [Candidatus Vogelbacteria bacterium]
MGKNKPIVSFTGEGFVKVTPNQAVVTLTVHARSNDCVGDAITKQTKQKSDLLGFLRGLKVDDKNILSSGYTNGPELEYDNTRHKNLETGWFLATESVTVRVATELAGKVSGGASKWAKVDSTSFVVSRTLARETREKATEIAIADAEAKASKRAARLSLKLGDLVGFVEGGNGQTPQPQMNRMHSLALAAGAEAYDGSDASLSVGEAEISAAVVLTYELK